MHYAVARILHQHGLLARLYTDIYATDDFTKLFDYWPGWLRPAAVQRLLDRNPLDVPNEKITHFPIFGIEYYRHLQNARTSSERSAAFIWAGKRFAHKILKCGFGDAHCVYAYNTAAKEILQHTRNHGITGFLEQTIAPRKVEMRILGVENDTFPGWEHYATDRHATEYIDREQEEWETAHHIICASDFVRDGIIECGGNPDKCLVVPYGIDNRQFQVERHARRPGPLRVLTVGAVGLRKGSPYVLQAAKLLKGMAEFRMVGAIHVKPRVAAELSAHLHLTGMVARSKISEQYAWADVLLLPSLCEGSATSTYEAMLHHLPVICTPHAGSVARDGKDGYILPARDSATIAAKLEFLATHPDTLAEMAESAHNRALEYNREHYAERLLHALHAVSTPR